MRILTLFLLVLASAVLLGLAIEYDPGYALFSYDHWTVEMPLWFVLLLWLVSIVFIRLGAWLAKRIFSLSTQMSVWRSRKRQLTVYTNMHSGLFAWIEADWPMVEKYALRAAKASDKPVINYLLAAEAAQKQEKTVQAQRYIDKAYMLDKTAEVVVGIVQARVYIANKQYEQAVACLRHLYELAPKHKCVLTLLAQVYVVLQDWQSLHELAPELLQQQIVVQPCLQEQVMQAQRKVFAKKINDQEKLDLQAAWQRLSRKLQEDEEIVISYVARLLVLQLFEQADSVLRMSLDKHWRPSWVAMYPQAQTSATATHALQIAEKWLKQHPNDRALLECLGKLCLQNKLWGKAQQYFAASLNIEPSLSVYNQLSQLLMLMGESETALTYLQRGLTLALGHK